MRGKKNVLTVVIYVPIAGMKQHVNSILVIALIGT